MLTFSVFNNEPDVRPFSAGQMIFDEGQPGDLMLRLMAERVRRNMDR